MLRMNADPFGGFLLREPSVLAKLAKTSTELPLLACNDALERSATPYFRTAMGVRGRRAAHFPTGLRDSSLELHNS